MKGPASMMHPLLQSLQIGKLLIPWAPKPGQETDPDVQKEKQGPKGPLDPEMTDRLRDMVKKLDADGKPPMQAQKPDPKGPPKPWPFPYDPLSPHDDENCESLWFSNNKYARGKWIDERYGNSPKTINPSASRASQITEQDVRTFFTGSPTSIPLGTYHVGFDVFDTADKRIVSIASSNPLEQSGCEGTKQFFRGKIKDAADFEKNPPKNRRVVDGVLTSHTYGVWPYIVKIKLATGDIEFVYKDSQLPALSSNYRVTVDGENSYNKLVVCVVPWRAGYFLEDTCFAPMFKALQKYADDLSAPLAAASPGLLNNKIEVKLIVLC